ncbi:restriction endonuclease subunit S [Nocardiopsis dassonvillei]|uniref:restriction endonuclease subunit S n=1 Tax=Nocardiopsis dassonvillei TaxID=2014 RepID=UPI000B9D7619|nr:restriction endonuclease subunit S [Nocardiopsis dassonvillei]ASU57218.1 hypothetical protein CGQ36_06545 [Nocardiopsis dassonvillei]
MRIGDLFDVEYGHSLSLNKLEETGPDQGVAFVSRTAKNNGVAAWVYPLPDVEPLPAGLLTVCLRSRNYALATFVQPRPFYCGYHIYVLRPKRSMGIKEKTWWSQCIEANRFRYNFGRQANRTLADLELPPEVPFWVSKAEFPTFSSGQPSSELLLLDKVEWREFSVGQIFDLARGRNVLKREMIPGGTAYVSASASNNGISAWIDASPDFEGGQITVSSNGSVGEAFYQGQPFIASGDVTVLSPKWKMTEAAALFICSLLYREKYRWNYGRKWGINKIRETLIRLPVDSNFDPDWRFMEKYMKSLSLGGAVL